MPTAQELGSVAPSAAMTSANATKMCTGGEEGRRVFGEQEGERSDPSIHPCKTVSLSLSHRTSAETIHLADR